MTDYVEEQRNEIEALECIYPDELEVLSTSPYHVFTVSIASQNTEDDGELASCVIQFTYTDKYPDELPIIEFADTENLDEEDENMLLNFMKEQGEENLGMVMIFTLVSGIQERITDMMIDNKTRQVEELIRRKREVEEAEQKRFEGTVVSIETFLVWKTKFDTEMNESKRIKAESDLASRKLTGKELFLRDASMIDSDVKFLQEEGDSIEVDESLFQDMDDLALEDELDLEDG